MPRILTRTALATAFVTAIASAATAGPAGYEPFAFFAPHHNRDALGALWYPAAEGGRAFEFADSGVFYGVTVVEEAPVLDGQFPIVLLSHGMGGNIRSLAWLASGLAERGAVVVSVNHPNSTWGDMDPAANLNHGTRAQDLSRALDAVLANPMLQGHLDTSRIMAAGFSFGGWTALSLGGARADYAGYREHCATYGAASVHCGDMARSGVGLEAVSSADWNASYVDPRVTSVTAIEPGLVWGLTAEDVAGLIPDVTLIGFGAGADRMLATDFDGSGLADLLPEATLLRLAPATHFTGLPLCKPMGAAILVEEQDDPVCTDPEGTDRAAVHQAIIDQIAGALGL